MRVEELMSRSVRFCRAEDTLSTAAAIMWQNDSGALPVIDGIGELCGMVTDRDICMAAYTRCEPLARLRVADAMTRDVHVCRPEEPIEHAERVMQSRRVRRLPVVGARGELVGILTLNDLARAGRNRPGERGLTADAIETTLAEVGRPR